MAPTQAPAAEASFREVVGAVGSFLTGCGLPRTAALLHQEAPLAEPTATDLAKQAKVLTKVLSDLVAEVTGSSKENEEFLGGSWGKEQAWLDHLLAKVSSSASLVAHNATAEAAQGKTAEGATQSSPSTAAPTQIENTGEETTENVSASVEAQPVLPPPVPVDPPAPSAHYDSSRPAPPLTDGFPDEYRDDGDPGYRVLAISEVELLAELHEAYRAALAEVHAQTQVEGEQGSPGEQLAEATKEAANVAADAGYVGTDEPPAASAAPCSDAADELDGASCEGGADNSSQPIQNATAADPSPAEDSRAALRPDDSGDTALEPPELPASEEKPAEEVSLAAAAAKAQAAAAIAATTEPGAALLEQVWRAQVAQAQVAPDAFPHALSSSRKKAKKRGMKKPAYRYAPSGDDFYPAELDGVVYDSFPLRVVFERDRTGFEESKEFPILQNSIIAARYQVLNYLGSAAFSRAVQCLDLQRNEMVCMKIIKNEKDFVDQSLDEIKLLKMIDTNTENIDEKHCIRLFDCFYHKEHLIIVTELLRENLYEFSKWNREHGEAPWFTLGRLQKVSRQLLIALDYIHSLALIHSDVKPENILVQSYSRCLVKLIDFGSSCFIDDHLSSYVQSRSYRAPEVLLGLPYGQKIDIWSLGCVIAECLTGYVLFQNDSVQSLLARVIGIIGPFPPAMLAAGRFVPNYFTQDGRLFKEMEVEMPTGPDAPPPEMVRRIQLLLPKRSSLRQRMRICDESFEDFISCLLSIDPAGRPSAAEALQHPWLDPGRYSDGL